MPDAVDLVRSKRDGGRLSAADIRWLIAAYTDRLRLSEDAAARMRQLSRVHHRFGARG